jgi:hypothetical protein
MATDPARLGGDMPTGRIVAGTLRRPGHDLAAVAALYDAPFPDARYKAGARRFPWCIPFAEPAAGNAADQERCFRALPRLGPEPFLVVNGDIWTDFDFRRLPQLDAAAHAALVLVPNPPQHPRGDFNLAAAADGRLRDVNESGTGPRYTFSGIAVYRTAFFAGCTDGKFPLLPLLRRAIAAGTLRGEPYAGLWYDIGTPERLRELDQRLADGAVG